MMSEAVKPWAEGERISGWERHPLEPIPIGECDHHYVPTITVVQWIEGSVDLNYETTTVERMTCR
jgi:hypothetical protein